jgi:hypothetical protein
MEKKITLSNIPVANTTIVAINVDNLPNWKINSIGSHKDIPQLLYKDGYWVSVQDMVLCQAADDNIQGIEAKNIDCVYYEDTKILSIRLIDSWSLAQIICVMNALCISEEAACIYPCDGYFSIDASTENYTEV